MISLSSPLLTTGCSDWLDLTPNNEKVTADYWQSKEDVEAVVASGYYYMREALSRFVLLGEVRGGDLYTLSSGEDAKIQNFDILESNGYADYSFLYQIISMANSVIKYAPDVQSIDKTYYTSMMQSHLCEAYFQRAYAYSILVKNWKEVPLILDAYVNDEADFKPSKASESEIIAQIRKDVEAALATGAAKGNYESDWQTKGRATKWALYALMADISLWNHDYDACIRYADLILEAQDALRPAFMSDMSHFFEIFYPGLSNESIFELYWDYNTEARTNSLMTMFAHLVSSSDTEKYNISASVREKMIRETAEVLANKKNGSLSTEGRVGRMLMTTYICGSTTAANSSYVTAQQVYLWKYRGTDIVDPATYRIRSDANFILYRVADVLLMKAEALVMKGAASWPEAISLINRIRHRAGLPDYIDLSATSAQEEINTLDEYTLLTEVLDQRQMEFVGEAKRWYDILRLARYDKRFAPTKTMEEIQGQSYETYRAEGFGQDHFAYMEKAVELITSANTTTSRMQLKSVLQNAWAWYLPIPYSELSVNENLTQNPYYE